MPENEEIAIEVQKVELEPESQVPNHPENGDSQDEKEPEKTQADKDGEKVRESKKVEKSASKKSLSSNKQG